FNGPVKQIFRAGTNAGCGMGTARHAMREGRAGVSSSWVPRHAPACGPTRSGHLRPSAVGVAAGGAAHGLRPTVDPDAMHEVTALCAATVVIVLGDDFPVAAIVGITPAHRLTWRPTLPSVVFGLPR